MSQNAPVEIKRERLMIDDEFTCTDNDNGLAAQVGAMVVMHIATGTITTISSNGSPIEQPKAIVEIKRRLVVQADAGVYYLDVDTGDLYHNFSDIVAIGDVVIPATVLLSTPL
jgi:hypothetical protein